MTSDSSKISLIIDMLESAQSSIRSAKQVLSEVTGMPIVTKSKYIDKASTLTNDPQSEGKIIEGVFDGQNMIDKQASIYPVPANYASKSKLIPGDVLKLTITDEGRFIYKQIKPAERKSVVGPLINEDGQYKVLANGKSYKVLLASVTYFRADVGDEVTLVIPATEESTWGAIEAILPKIDTTDITDTDLDDEEYN